MNKTGLIIAIAALTALAAPLQAARPQIAMGHIGLALKSDGSVWAWGDSCGSAVASQLKGPDAKPLRRVKSIATSGLEGILLVRDDGTLLQAPSCHAAFNPVVDVSGKVVDKVIAASGFDITVMLKSDGSVWNFGTNAAGQLGTGPAGGSSDFAVRVKTGPSSYLSGITAIRAAHYFSAAVKKDGTLWTWGYWSGWPGSYYARPFRDKHGTMLTQVKALGTAGDLDLIHVIKEDGTLWAVSLTNGEVSQIMHGNRSAVRNVRAVDGSNMYGSGGAIAVDEEGNVGQIGSSPRTEQQNADNPDGYMSPFRVKAQIGNLDADLRDVDTVAGSLYDVLALKNDGTVWQWGQNSMGTHLPLGSFKATQVMQQGGQPLQLVVPADGSCSPL